jgi:hypothetical protein
MRHQRGLMAGLEVYCRVDLTCRSRRDRDRGVVPVPGASAVRADLLGVGETDDQKHHDHLAVALGSDLVAGHDGLYQTVP